MVSIPQSVSRKPDLSSHDRATSSINAFGTSRGALWRPTPGARSQSSFRALMGLAALFCAYTTLICSCATLQAQVISGEPSGAPPQVPLPQNPSALPLSAAAQASLQALALIERLPAETWHVHDGDLPHGEAIDLDDSGWPTVQGPYLGKTGTMWFRRTIVVPANLHGYDLTGTDIHFAFDIWAEGPVPVIIYFDGRRVAMGEAMEPISLFTNAHPGDKISIAVKALDSADAKHFRAANLKIEFAKQRPDPRTVRLEALSATYLLPALLDRAPEQTAELTEDQSTLESALAAVDMAALAEGRQQRFDASLRAAQAKLEPLRPLLSQARIHLTGNSHIDAAWVWPWTETVDVVHRTFSTALQLMQEYPDYTYSQSASAYYEWMAEKYPPIQRGIATRIQQGRWEAVGGMWVEPDLNLLDGESIVRQLLVGTRYLKQEYNAPVRIGWNPDTFGFTWQLPQIYKKSGIDYFVTQKMGWNESNLLPLKLFYWQSPDGSRVLTYFPHDYNNPIEPEKLAADFNVALRQNPGIPEMMHLYGVGDHGGGPTRTMLDFGDQWMQTDKVFGTMRYGTALSYFNDVEPKLDTANAPVWNYASMAAGKGQLPLPSAGKISVPVWNDELYLEYTRGVYTTEATQKRNMRESEEWMLDAEKWSALNFLMGAGYPAAPLNEAWKKVLFNQFHDIAGGSGVTVLYKDAQRDYDNAHLVANAAQSSAIDGLSSYIQTAPARQASIAADSVPLIVWNSLAWSRTGVVQADIQLPSNQKAIQIVDAEGQPVLSQANKDTGSKAHIAFLVSNIPALGYAVFYARPSKQAAGGKLAVDAKVQPDTVTLHNQFLTVVVDRHSGCITSLTSNADGFNSIAAGGCGNQLQVFKDTPTDYDAWNIDPGTLDHFSTLPALDSAELIETGPLCATLQTRRHWQHSSFEQDIQLCAGVDHVDISNDVDWHERHVLLKAAFPLAASSAMATYEIPYGSIERPTTRTNRWDAAKFEVPALRWADLGDAQHGFSLINEAKYGYDAKDNVLRLTLLRSSTAPDPVADQGEQRFAFSLYPHADGWKQAQTVRRGYEFNYKLEAEQAQIHPGTLPSRFSFVSVTPQNLTLTALKKSEDGQHLVVRFYEWAGQAGVATISVPRGVTGATLTNLMEEPEGAPLAIKDSTVSAPFTPYSIITVRLDLAKSNDPTTSSIAKAP
jgi:alpha-mannosidase